MSRSGFDPTIERALECSPRAPGQARRAVGELASELEEALLHGVQLLVSELVTNSVRHSGSTEPIRLRVWTRSGGLRVEVADAGCGFEGRTRPADGEDEGGRGLLILESLADRWGISHDAMTRVWFEVAGQPASRPRAQAG